ncbi:hypothetical protein F5B22DRAFT_546037 [Xylaria bambusicola]|uniref:uncharacterized protein n=1 Tax=Xylaria bambusicola TaxID=326684 RepID=UPI0020087298|nr:uncharacterized protein F5B22DRAFT_546037 [Xylaria bambusicola]KAI0521654.1 hypothetical protein F5B22DRAFT_546037 [Xylaria bambusicola]
MGSHVLLLTLYFDSALGWHSRGYNHRPRRRSAVSGASYAILTPSELPSWSWIGWQERITTDHCDGARILGKSNNTRETFPITTWFTAKLPTAVASERRRILSTWPEDRIRYKDLSRSLPPGWQRHNPPKFGPQVRPIVYPDGCGQYVFSNEAMMKNSNEREGLNNLWYYPVPIAEISASTPPFIPEQTAYLFCETFKVRLLAVYGRLGDTLYLYDAAKKIIGFLIPPLPPELATLPQERKKEVELVAISRIKRYEVPYLFEEDRFASYVTTSEHIAVL